MNKFYHLYFILFALLVSGTLDAQQYRKSYLVPGTYPTVDRAYETADQYIFQITTFSNNYVYDLQTNKTGTDYQIVELPHDLYYRNIIREKNGSVLSYYDNSDSTSIIKRWTADNTVLWEKEVKLPGNPACNKFYGTMDKGIEITDGYLFLGTFKEEWPNSVDSIYCVATIIDYSGNIISQNKNSGNYYHITTIKQLDDKYFFLHTPFGWGTSSELTWLDTSGNWAPLTSGYHNNFNYLSDMDVNGSGDLAMVGFNLGPNVAEFIGRALAYDSNFQLIWEKAGWPELEYATSLRNGFYYRPRLITSIENGWLMAGIIDALPRSSVFLAQLDSDGNIVQCKIYSPLDISGPYCYTLNKTSDRGYLLSFISNSEINVLKTDSSLMASPNQISGYLVQDINLNCETDTLEPGLPGRILALLSAQDTTFTYTLSNGYYELPADTGSFVLEVRPIGSYWEPCENNIPIYFPGENIFDTIHFNIQPIVECPQMEVDISQSFARRCFDNQLYINYCNNGTVAADSARLEVILDPLMSYVSSQVPVSAIHGDTLVFDLGTVGVLACDHFQVTIHIDCDSSQLGQTVCVSAHIYPDSICLPVPTWSGGQLTVGGFCEQDSVVFWAQNVGTAATQQLDYVIIEDMVIWLESHFNPLLPGESDTIRIAADGSTFGLLAEQEPGFPYNAFSPLSNGPSAWVEACNWSGTGIFPGGFITQFPNEDGNPTTASDCNMLVGSFDPNDKTASPEGVGDKHFILPGTPLEYLIRFQNTGTDTAFRVVIRDQLPPQLDPLSLQVLSGSHAYKTDFEPDNVLKFTFDQILLPDSNINEPASHGFIKFRIRPKTDLPIGTKIENTAAIFFDFNDPVYTNTCFHTVDTLFMKKETDGVWEGNSAGPITNRIIPNPVGNQIFIQLVGRENFTGKATIFDISGKPVEQLRSQQGKIHLPAHLARGAYFLKTEDGWVAKLVVL